MITSSTTNIKDVGTVVYSIDECALSIFQSLKLNEPEKLVKVATLFKRCLMVVLNF